MLCHSGYIAHQVGTKAVDILTGIGHTRFLGSYPQQVGIVYVEALDTNVLLTDVLLVIKVARWHTLNLVGVDIHAQ